MNIHIKTMAKKIVRALKDGPCKKTWFYAVVEGFHWDDSANVLCFCTSKQDLVNKINNIMRYTKKRKIITHTVKITLKRDNLNEEFKLTKTYVNFRGEGK